MLPVGLIQSLGYAGRKWEEEDDEAHDEHDLEVGRPTRTLDDVEGQGFEGGQGGAEAAGFCEAHRRRCRLVTGAMGPAEVFLLFS